MNEGKGIRFISSLFSANAQKLVWEDSFGGENENNWIMVGSTSMHLS